MGRQQRPTVNFQLGGDTWELHLTEESSYEDERFRIERKWAQGDYSHYALEPTDSDSRGPYRRRHRADGPLGRDTSAWKDPAGRGKEASGADVKGKRKAQGVKIN